MLRSIKDMESFAIRATDGMIGHAMDFLFDDGKWVIRYLVVNTGTWLSGRGVLVSPIALGHPDWATKVLPLSITKARVKDSPDIDTKKPVSRQHEMSYISYYGYQDYWSGGALWGDVSYPALMMPAVAGLLSKPGDARSSARRSAPRAATLRKGEDPHLRSSKVVLTYNVEASDGDIGHVEDMLVDEETWAIRYIVVNTSNWWLGHQVLIAPQWIQDVRWSDDTVSVNLTRQAVKDAPPYDPTALLDRDQELGIHAHYGRSAYWVDEEKREAGIAPH